MEAPAVPVEDRETLKRFLMPLRGLLERLAQDPDDLLKQEPRPLVAAAWDELVAEKRFEELDRAIDSGDYDRGMIDHGLRGAQLKLKIEGFDLSLEAVRREERKRFLPGLACVE